MHMFFYLKDVSNNWLRLVQKNQVKLLACWITTKKNRIINNVKLFYFTPNQEYNMTSEEKRQEPIPNGNRCQIRLSFGHSQYVCMVKPMVVFPIVHWYILWFVCFIPENQGLHNKIVWWQSGFFRQLYNSPSRAFIQFGTSPLFD